MTHRIVFKIWTAFFITLVVSVFGIFFLMDLSFKREFHNYAVKQAMSSFGRLEASVIEYYNQYGSIEGFRTKPKYWSKIKHQAFDFRARMIAPSKGRAYLEHQRGTVSRPLEKSNQAKSIQARSGRKIDHYRKFIKNIILVDTHKSPIVGTIKSNVNYTWYEILVDDNPLGYFGYVKPKNLLRQIDHDFVHKQAKHFGLICAILLLVSLFVAALIARRIATPIGFLSDAAQKLAAGDYAVRVKPTSTDEIGSLCNNVNELAQTLEANDKMRGQWVADISHEMRTPVSVLKAQIEAMQDGIRAPSEKNLNVLHASVTNLSLLIDNLFELSLADIGALNYRKQQVNIFNTLEDITDALEAKIKSVNLQLVKDINIAQKSEIYADEARLHQLFENLIENSIRYTNTGGEVKISCKKEINDFLFCVEDSSPGVPIEKHKKIFDRLYRLELSRARETGGAGLGLAICKNIVDAHQGEIWAEHSTLGGLAVYVRIPARSSYE